MNADTLLPEKNRARIFNTDDGGDYDKQRREHDYTDGGQDYIQQSLNVSAVHMLYPPINLPV